MARGLSVSGVVNVSVNLAPRAASLLQFGTLLVLGASSVIDLSERQREYFDPSAVLGDFGVGAPEYAFALWYFSQKPRPKSLIIGRWAQAAAAGRLRGAILTGTQQLVTAFTAITAGALKLSIDGTVTEITGLDLSGITNINGAASALQAKLAAAKPNLKVVFDGVQKRFLITSGTTGAASTFGFPVAPSTGTDVAALFGLTSAGGATVIPGQAAESLVDAIAKHADLSGDWYGLTVATTAPVSDDDHLAAAAFIEAGERDRVYGVTITSTSVLDRDVTTDLGSKLKALGYRKTVSQYSSVAAGAVASFLGRAFTVDFTASNTTITMKFKDEPGVVAEVLTETQAKTLRDKNVNVFAQYNNGTAIVQEGVAANGEFFDTVHGLDWTKNALQNAAWNTLRAAKKVPQTDGGTHRLVVALTAILDQAVKNGFVAPGVWNADGFGDLDEGDFLPTGYYVYAPPVATQDQSDREARKSVPIQIAIKLAGAVHTVDVQLDVNR